MSVPNLLKKNRASSQALNFAKPGAPAVQLGPEAAARGGSQHSLTQAVTAAAVCLHLLAYLFFSFTSQQVFLGVAEIIT